jgi:hypothetical protein
MRLVLAALVALALVIVLAGLSLRAPSEGPTFVSQREALQPIAARPFGEFRARIKNLMNPILRHFQRRRSVVLLSTGLILLPQAVAGETGLGSPQATNSDGLHAWVLAQADLDAFELRCKSLPGYEYRELPYAAAADGATSVRFTGRGIGLGTNVVNYGLHTIATAKIVAYSPTLTLAVWDTEPETNSLSVPPPELTNFVANCRLTLAPRTTLVLCDTGHTNGAGKNHWFTLNAIVIDPSGKHDP